MWPPHNDLRMHFPFNFLSVAYIAHETGKYSDLSFPVGEMNIFA